MIFARSYAPSAAGFGSCKSVRAKGARAAEAQATLAPSAKNHRAKINALDKPTLSNKSTLHLVTHSNRLGHKHFLNTHFIVGLKTELLSVAQFKHSVGL